MRKLSAALLGFGALGLVLFAHPVQAANLLINGGFEDGNFTGWMESGNLANTLVSNSPNVPFEGNYAAQLGAVSSDNMLSQTVTTSPGQTYTVSFWHIYTPDAGPTGNIIALWDGIKLYSVISHDPPAPQTWTQYSFNVTGTGADTLEFDSRSDPSYQGLDGVSVAADLSPVPLPAALPLFGSALLMLGLLFRGKIRSGFNS